MYLRRKIDILVLLRTMMEVLLSCLEEYYLKHMLVGTLMECYVHPNMDYLNIHQVVSKQRMFIYSYIMEKSKYVPTV